MPRLQFRIIDLFLAIAAVAVFAGFWDRHAGGPYGLTAGNAMLMFATNLALVSIATAVVIMRRPAPFAFGYAMFSWPFLALVLRGSFVDGDDYAQMRLFEHSTLGIALATVCGLVVLRLTASRSRK
ncbi:MAG TPA: hypothetical protein VGJ15_02915 [Pirellulales bacterium]|jgi:hypothetical protein